LKSDIIAGLAARWARVPLIWHVRDRITEDYLPALVVRVFRFLSRRVPTLVVANSEATLQTLQLKDRQRTAVIYSGIELRPQEETDGESVRPHPPLIGLVGRITRWKGQDVFLRAAVKVLRRFPAARFQVIGAALFHESDFDREVKGLAHDLEIESSVEFTGFRDDVPDLLAKLDVLVHASTTGEPFGQVIVEGMAAGKPVVATDGGGVPEIVVHNETGLLVPMGDASAMADAICQILEAPMLAKKMGELGRRRVREHFTVERSAAKAQGLYDRLLTSAH
jgi:glycosyltransferase involved in cell wall biosynthesis